VRLTQRRWLAVAGDLAVLLLVGVDVPQKPGSRPVYVRLPDGRLLEWQIEEVAQDRLELSVGEIRSHYLREHG
jgi:hypothetical protein